MIIFPYTTYTWNRFIWFFGVKAVKSLHLMIRPGWDLSCGVSGNPIAFIRFKVNYSLPDRFSELLRSRYKGVGFPREGRTRVSTLYKLSLNSNTSGLVMPSSSLTTIYKCLMISQNRKTKSLATPLRVALLYHLTCPVNQSIPPAEYEDPLCYLLLNSPYR